MKSIIDAKKRAHFLSKKNGTKLKEALEIVANENQFSNWKDYKNSLDTFWYSHSSPFLNHWFASYEEARVFREKTSGFLLTYKGDYFVVYDDYIEYIGFHPKADIWRIINFDVSSSNALEKFYQYYCQLKKHQR